MILLIPKIIHYIWLGQIPMHPAMIAWREKWAALHPSWTIKVWKETDRPDRLANDDETVSCRHPAYLMKCPTLAKRSDVWRYDLLEQLGGMYLDTDMKPIKCIEEIIDGKGTFAGRCKTEYDWSRENPEGKIKIEVGCSLIGTKSHHPWIQDLFEHIDEQDPIAPLSLAFPYITKITARHPEVHLFEPEIFYPLMWRQLHPSSPVSYMSNPPIPESAYAAHLWSSNWFPNGLKPLQNPSERQP
jgi:mannosyltransferase OCH1-like enzyme